ncbi:AAA family ATPase [Aestuariicoccus sp. MJ-SS9]|uniref:AAA family ATPase n=1 Tax=Aestuariicoccus sp. MJ-SS9 TaxID=3079855 RepID=UPI00290875E1|nr:AAA family ATPase [Aestuariicoccus sp. MJ-SS9]MDU8912482.1 AAA family ATPase [Aestuariicoccus sp. MJ-SS9]
MMRLRKLDLELFGGFTGKRFDFGPRPDPGMPDFHVIYGPNEAGKTTTMEGYLRLLYGFPHREPYDFLHQRKNLRVSGLLDIDGTETAFTRLPTRDPSLRDAHGQELPNSALQAHLVGLSEEDYRNLLCLDDLTIEKGGEEITRAKGDIGRLLFSAAAGISELSDVLDSVRAEADGLYRKRASSTRLAGLKKEHAEIEKQIRQLDVSASQYRGLKKAADDALLEEAQVSKRRKELFAAKARLDARIKALPVLDEIGVLDGKLADFSTWPAQLDVDPEDLVRMLTRQTTAQSDITKLGEELEGLRSDLAAIEHHPEHLALTQELQDLDALRSRYATADLDLDRRRKALEQVLADMGLAARDLGAPADIDSKELVLSSAALSELEQARERMRDAEAMVTREHGEVAAIDEKIDAAKEQLRRLGAEESASVDFAEILERFDVDTLSARHAAASEALKTARRNRHTALDALTIKGQSFDALPTCSLTMEEADTLLGDVQETTQRHETAVQELENVRGEIAERDARIAQIKAMDGLVDDDETRSMRACRDDLWKAHRSSMTNQSADAFEGAMARVDTAMDLRLSQAADLGTLRQQERDLAAAKAKAGSVEQQVSALEQVRNAILERLAGASIEAGLETTLAPDTFVNWLRKLELASLADAELLRLQDEHQETFKKADRLIKVLSEHIHRDMPEFDDLVAVAKANLAAQRTHQEDLRSAKTRVDDLTRDRTKRTEKLAVIEVDASNARRDWVELVAAALPKGLDAGLLEASLQPLQDLREHDKERVVLERQVSTMEGDQAQFAEKIQKLVKRVGAIATASPLADYDALKAMSEAAVGAEEQARDLNERIKVCEKSLADAQKVLGDIDLAVAELARIFPDDVDTSSLGALRQAVSTASDVIADRARRTELERAVTALLDLENLEDARAVLSEATQTGLQAEMDEVSADLEGIDNRYKGAIEARTSAEQELRATGGDADVALLVERKTTLELEMQDAALRHLELSLGYRLAETAIRRYRDAHRSAMMQATEAAFAELTNGAYSKLQTQIDGASETLLALDASGMAKQAQDMSKGTRFQLYLALRAAAYEQLADQGASLPFFCDDIFETFDEERTRSACRVMERVGRRGQAIYLTHHQHVVDIAREVCGEGVQIHNIQA